MPKKLDALHYLLTGLLLGIIWLYIYPLLSTNNNEASIDKYSFLLAKYQADSLVIAEQYDDALAKFKEIDRQYTNQINLTALTAMIALKQEEHEAFLTIQNSGSLTQNPKKVATSTVLKITNFDGAEIDYMGEVKNNQAHGYGFAIFEKKGFYKGEWANNKRNGEGTYSWQNGDVYVGHYIDGYRSGFGIYTFVTGEVYEGYWKNNLRNGEGTLVNKGGKIVSTGPWIDDEPVLKRKPKKKK